MTYSEYIRLGFKRIDFHDEVEFQETGYYGFALERRINKRMVVAVSGARLDEPKLYITRQDDSDIIIPLTDAAVYAMFEL